ncbi:MAG: diaminopimelate epimerase, partial [Paramuribaculum sp.]|nr:diaminopimelate epimerase [Paramuribaculum sp.]
MENIRFTKMHGIGNDYIYINCMDGEPDSLPQLSRLLSDRHKGIGGDGIILICPSETADFKMRIFNADGSEAKMCGNGSRCVGKFVYDKNLTDKKTVSLETLAGIKILQLHTSADNKVESVTVDMGEPSLDPKAVGINAEGNRFVERPVPTSRGDVCLTA